MARVPHHTGQQADGVTQTWRVVDDLPLHPAVAAAELDAVEAFLMPLLNAIMSNAAGEADGASPAPSQNRRADSQKLQTSGRYRR
ncbi:hypothetical protein T281_06835 [Rhodomicrobium udaipurense JA643]|uniref:Uncharacterized protein n=1 Tax=Rhodomicrobium udaipurense TaxID=1202716 RepID=A0A8I1KFP9_9HYPH|nr:hypothetical protein [Rhodomicrobium udaipurense]KAI95193.1 hypothetical protein T281_06835 [Rhodomicrobium udaipurense JA643]MBJ7541945.1 hypothetical protein [Rhodomicrobium udaipurense]